MKLHAYIVVMSAHFNKLHIIISEDVWRKNYGKMSKGTTVII